MMAAEKLPDIRGVLKAREPMSKHTSWRVGGLADRLFTPADIEDLAHYLQQVPESEPLTWIGLGSNLLVRDGGIRGSVISLKGAFADIKLTEQGTVYAEAGVSCARLARFCKDQGLSGAEFLAGIPGLLGGSLAMNAGAFGSETWSFVQSVTTLDRQGNLHQRKPDEFSIAYRSVKTDRREWFVAAELKFEKTDSSEAADKIRALLAKRNETQPIGEPSCGSVFRNPEGDFAARLIETAGLKGYRLGGAQVSEKHANFIINADNASAKDIEQLIRLVQETVQQKHGIDLHTEVVILGDQDHD